MENIKIKSDWFTHSLLSILCYNGLILAIGLLLNIGEEGNPYRDVFMLIWGVGNSIIPIIIGMICFITNNNMFNFKKIFRYINFFRNPCENCIIYKEIGCSYAKSDLCDYPICSLLKDYKNAKKRKK